MQRKKSRKKNHFRSESSATNVETDRTMQAAAPPLSLPQQHQRVDAPQSLPSTRGGDGGASTSNGGGGSKTQNHQQHQSHAARISEAVAKDLAALANPDVSTPFASVDDAVDRLLPYHVSRMRGGDASLREEKSGMI